jgi:hypothetical protein
MRHRDRVVEMNPCDQTAAVRRGAAVIGMVALVVATLLA